MHQIQFNMQILFVGVDKAFNVTEEIALCSTIEGYHCSKQYL